MVNINGGCGWILMKVYIERRPLLILIMVNNDGGGGWILIKVNIERKSL
ncbi:MAG: hypothetical protein Satyrvirus34_4 [Satyrvirus sp.]|uniref:Uncharacterized protein n=1 Tax=Satyrvirus sp. TaxID=2487771 RepID=A0A3G5AGJ9_9VIRU|nr:MAG: hypothetical protein Satyrvirus34_4 [Satyrvirus sp.]